MKLPDSLIICNVPYALTEVLGLKKEDTSLYGLVSHTELIIQVEQALADTTKLQALLHESLHGILHQTGHFDIDQEERVVQALGCQLIHFIRQNPELIDLIRGAK